ncbi:acyl carrier protein [Planctomycetota bacterium]
MTDSEIEREVIDAIARVTGMDATMLGDEVDLREDLGFDSLTGLRVVAALEKHFDVILPNEELDRCRTVGAAVAAFKARLDQRG